MRKGNTMMKIEYHPSSERGKANHGWLDTRFSFSFAEYHNPERMGFGALRVLNEDHIEPAQGFGMHPHNNMEIVTIVLEGALEHQDSMGNRGVIRSGDVQRMSAGTGVVHSEFNHSKTEKIHLLQIWVQTKERNIRPSYEQKSFPDEIFKNKFYPVVTGKRNPESVYIHQNAAFLLGRFDKNRQVSHTAVTPGNGAFLFVIDGDVNLDGRSLKSGDAAALSDFDRIDLSTNKSSHLLLIETPL